MFLIVLYSYIVARFLKGSLTSSLLTSYILVTGGVAQVTCGRYSMQIYYRLSYISFLKAQSLRLMSAQYIVFTYSRIRFSIIMLISFIKQGIRGIVLGHISYLFYILSCKPKQASHFLPKIMSWFPRSIIRRGVLYCLRPSMRRWIRKILVIVYPICLLYLRIEIGLGSSSRGAFKKSASFIAYLVLIKAKAFISELAKAKVKT